MYCPKCGALNTDDAIICNQCGQPLQQGRAQVPPPIPSQYQQYQVMRAVPDYLPWAILVTLCCCLPFGIVSIVYSVQANTHAAAGNYHVAMEAARKAKFWLWLGFWIGLLSALLYFFFIFILQILEVASGS